MRTVTYAIYDGTSGEIVHLHVEPAELESSPEEIIHMAGKPKDARLKVVRVPDELASGALCIEKGQVRAAKQGETFGGAGIHSPTEEPDAPRKYVNVSTQKGTRS